MSKTGIQVVANFAFVLSVYDYTDTADLSPSVDGMRVGYVVHGWTGKGFKIMRFHEVRAEAIKEAAMHHNEWCKKLGLGTAFYLWAKE